MNTFHNLHFVQGNNEYDYYPQVDDTLSVEGRAADAKVVGNLKSATTYDTTEQEAVQVTPTFTVGYINLDGTSAGGIGYYHTNEIPVQEGDYVTYCKADGTKSVVRSYVAYVNGIADANLGTAGSGSVANYTVPATVTGIVLNPWADNVSNGQYVYIIRNNPVIKLKIDKTFTLSDYAADAYETGKMLSTIENMEGKTLLNGVTWEIGTINAAAGTNENSITRVRTVGYIDLTDISEFHVDIATGFKYVVDWYDSSKNRVNTTIYGAWQTINQDIQIPNGVKYMRLIVADTNNEQASVSYSNNIAVYYYTPLIAKVMSIQEEYAGFDNAVAIKKNFSGTISAVNNLTTLPSIIHTSDVHGDSVRLERAIDVFKKLGCDLFVCSGDMVRYNSTDDFNFFKNAVNDISFVHCMGNHETFKYATEQEVYEKFIYPFIGDFSMPTGVTYPTYYFKDISAKNLRFISINQYQSVDGISTNHNTVHFLQEQITWFANTLLSTPANYGVIVVMHTPEQKPVIDSSYTKFKQKNVPFFDNVRYKPITEIIDAFISGGTLSKTYNNGDGYTPATFTVSADFSTKNTGVEFIAYLTGHMHTDNISYVPNTTNKQLMLNIVCTNAWTNKTTSGSDGTTYPYFNELNDLGRMETGETQDAFNVYVIDRTEKTVRIARIGADLPYDAYEKRDYMSIPYID